MVDAVGDYQVLAGVGAGEHGTFLRALDQRSGRPVAIKRVADAASASSTRLGAYSRLIGLLQHPNIVQVLEVLRTPDDLFLVEEWVDGAALDDVGSEPLDGRTAVAVLIGVLEGLAHAHARGIVHGNVCPATVLISDTGEPRLTDFDLSGPLGAVRVPRSEGFASPEASAGRVQIPASDVYSAAVVLLAVTYRPDEEKPSSPVPGLSRRIGAVLATALDPVPENRYADAGAFLRALEAAAAESFGRGWAARLDLAPLSRGSRTTRQSGRPRSAFGRKSRATVGGAGILPGADRRLGEPGWRQQA